MSVLLTAYRYVAWAIRGPAGVCSQLYADDAGLLTTMSLGRPVVRGAWHLRGVHRAATSKRPAGREGGYLLRFSVGGFPSQGRRRRVVGKKPSAVRLTPTTVAHLLSLTLAVPLIESVVILDSSTYAVRCRSPQACAAGNIL
jgi:hypothetical protein